MAEAPEVQDNAARHRYELTVGEHIAFANYRRRDDIIDILHVEAPEPMRGTGAAGQLMQGIVAAAQKENMKINPTCGYAASWLRRHPEHAAIIAA